MQNTKSFKSYIAAIKAAGALEIISREVPVKLKHVKGFHIHAFSRAINIRLHICSRHLYGRWYPLCETSSPNPIPRTTKDDHFQFQNVLEKDHSAFSRMMSYKESLLEIILMEPA
jgi:hypothetical protein